jgi:hypothetical protein
MTRVCRVVPPDGRAVSLFACAADRPVAFFRFQEKLRPCFTTQSSSFSFQFMLLVFCFCIAAGVLFWFGFLQGEEEKL